MPRRPRICPIGIPQHIIQRGNNRQVCFAAEEDFAAYAEWLHEASRHYQVAIHAWVFMTNHVHLLATPSVQDGVSRMMQSLGRRYVRYFNSRYRRSGTLWEGRFRSCVIDSDQYLLTCQRYIELNPVRAGMVEHPAGYRWSSYHAHGREVEPRLWTPHPGYLALGNDTRRRAQAYRELFEADVPESCLEEVRHCVNKGFALGSDRFRLEIERLTGVRQRQLKPGRKGTE